MAKPNVTRAFPNGRSTAVRIPAEFGLRPGDEVVIALEGDGSIRLSRAQGLSRFLAVLEKVGPLSQQDLRIPRMGKPRKVSL